MAAGSNPSGEEAVSSNSVPQAKPLKFAWAETAATIAREALSASAPSEETSRWESCTSWMVTSEETIAGSAARTAASNVRASRRSSSGEEAGAAVLWPE